MKVQGVSINSANVRYNNASDDSRVYEIEANVATQGNAVSGIDGGVVKKNGITVATFSAWGSKVNSTFQGLSKSEACEVSNTIYDFIGSVKESVSVQVIDL